jgi:ERCC4-type nuclease
MIVVDSRTGSKELLPLLRQMGVQADLGGYIAADFQFEGHGEKPLEPIIVGVERKTVQDMIGSIRERRLLGAQLPEMARAYQVVEIIMEGTWRRNRDTGLVEVPTGAGKWVVARGSMHHEELAHFLMRLQDLGILVWRTFDERETAAWLKARYNHYQQPYSERVAKLHVVYAPPPEVKRRGRRIGLLGARVASFKECVAAQLPGVDSRAIELAAQFPSAKALANATVEDWVRLKGVGKKGAQTIVQAWEQEEN